MPGLAILVPVLGRPHRVQPLVDSIRATTPGARILFIADPGDAKEHAAITKDGRGELVLHGGNYASKINHAVATTDEEFVFLGADDLEFHRGWLEAALLEREPTGAGVVGTQDLCNRRVIAGQHSTHSLVSRAYCERGTIDDPSKVLHEGYAHEYVDDEFVETAKARDEFVFADAAVVEHLHPMVGKAPMDDLYENQRRRMRMGRRLYRHRARLWSPQ